MKPVCIAVLLLLGCYCAIGADPSPESLSFQQAKELGRSQSRYLDEKQQAEQVNEEPNANVLTYQKVVAPALTQSCLACHGPETSEGNLRVDELDPDLLTGSSVAKWREVYNVLSNSEMPPEDEPDFALADSDRSKIVDWLSAELNKASRKRRDSEQHSSFRRLTKYEYDYAIHDLLGLAFPVAENLPPETASEDGFKNSSELLQMSAMQFEAYREIALKALNRAIVVGDRPEPIKYIISMPEEMKNAVPGKRAKAFHRDDDSYRKEKNRSHLFDPESGNGIHFSNMKATPNPKASIDQTPELSPVAMVLPRSNELKVDLDRFLPDEGIMRVRIRAGRSTMKPEEYASLRLSFSAHTSNNANFSNVVSQRDIPVTASADDPEFIHFDISLGDIQRNPFRKLETTFPRRDEFLHIRNISNARGGEDRLNLLIDYIEISAPYFETWPPTTHTNIFFESDSSENEKVYGREVLNRFLQRVWRRPVLPREVDPFISLFENYRPNFATFEEAMVEVLATALATPEFLYVTQRATKKDGHEPEQISDFELASRLSIFLWSSVPDDRLLQLAKRGKLSQSDVLESQVRRMLDDPRAERFSKHFVDQWLGLDRLDSATHVTDASLREAMSGEPIAFFTEVLRSNRSVMDFIHSDYLMVNERLASHYGIGNVFGPDFRKVAIDPKNHRGGLLTGAAVLAMNSDGTDSNPLKRGVWMLERVLHDPPPPPPPDVPEVDLTDPEILKMTLKERIADHRNKPACASCHSRIDPWGIAFENYDALGVFRTRIKNKPVDATSQLFNKQTLDGMEGLKRYLLTDRQDQFARAMVHKMTAYALGRPLSFADRAEIDNLTSQFRKQEDRLADLVHLITRSKIFNSK